MDRFFDTIKETSDTRRVSGELSMSDQEIIRRILDKSLEHFLQFGFSKVTMNEIAEDLGMSKKTLYHYFPSKEELLLAVMNRLHAETGSRIDAVVDDKNLSFAQKFRSILSTISAFHARMSPHFLADLQRHAPEAGRCSKEFRNERMRGVIGKLLDEGIREGIIRQDINQHLIGLMYVGAVQMLLDPERLSELSMTVTQVHQEVSKTMFGGILTDGAKIDFLLEPVHESAAK
jgi:AcrR family transcriptional regulator